MTKNPVQLSLLGDAPTQFAPATPEEAVGRRERLCELLDDEAFADAAALINELFARGEVPTLALVFGHDDNKKVIEAQWNTDDAVPIDVIIAVYSSIEDPKQKWNAAALIDDGKKFRELMLEKWKAGNLDEAALLYSVAYADPFTDSRDTLACVLDGAPIELLRQLHTYAWWPSQRISGIKDWLKDEIAAHES